MNSLRNKFLFSFSLIIALVVGTCCSDNKHKGVQDSGGGSAQYSTADQVQAHLRKAIKLAGETDLQKNIFAQFWIQNGRKSENPVISNPRHSLCSPRR